MRQELSFDLLPVEVQKKLQDLSESLKEITTDKEGWCYKYREKKDIGKKIFDDFVKYNRDKTKKDNCFIFSDEIEETGLISQLQGMQVLAMLWEEFGLEADLNVLKTLIDDVLSRIRTTDGKYQFDATPYLTDAHQFDEILRGSST